MIFKISKIMAVISLFILGYNSMAAQVRVTALSDLSESWAGEGGSKNLNLPLCVYSDTGNYEITAEGTGVNNGRFRVFRDAINTNPFLNYTVRWNDQPNTSGQVRLTQQVALTGQTTSETASDDCSGGTNLTAHIQVRFGNGQLSSRPAGTYTGNLTITVSHP